MNGQERNPEKSKAALPDVAFDSDSINLPLAWVGMNEIEIPVRVTVNGEKFLVPARAEVKVRLNTSDRGIHMSRLFVGLQKEIANTEVSSKGLEALTTKLLDSQKSLSDEVYVALRFELPLLQPSLLSHNEGWRTYPVEMIAMRNALGFREFLDVKVTYSSTCPMSAALARQLNAEAFDKKFAETHLSSKDIKSWLESAEGMAATPHAQRSLARVRIEKAASTNLDLQVLINIIENALQTAVQSAVKREDEQEFARRNAQNLMFCEDAARKVQKALMQTPGIQDFYGEFHHLESLHPHNAVSHIQKSRKTTGQKNSEGLNSFAIPVSRE